MNTDGLILPSLLTCLILLATALKISFFRLRSATMINVIWGIVAYLTLQCLTKMSGIDDSLNQYSTTGLALAIIDSLIFIVYCLKRYQIGTESDLATKLNRVYPGVSLFFPIILFDRALLINYPGRAFALLGVIAGAATAVTLTLCAILLMRFCNVDKRIAALYLVAVATLILSILISGLS